MSAFLIHVSRRLSGTFALALLSSLAFTVAPIVRAEGKPAAKATVLPAAPLGDRQRADLAAKGVPEVREAPLVAPVVGARNTHTEGPTTSLARRKLEAEPASGARTFRRLPSISEAMGPIPRESWYRLALGKPADVAIVGGVSVPVVPAGPAR